MSALNALIVGLPWVRCGTARVVAQQLAWLRARGWRTTFVAVPPTLADHDANPIWRTFAARCGELGADRTHVATFSAAGRQLRYWRAVVRHLVAGTDALRWRLEPARRAPLSRELVRLAASPRTRLLLVNHVYALPFARRLRRASGRRDLPLVVVTHDVQAQLLSEHGQRHPLTRQAETEVDRIDSELAELAHADVLVHIAADDHAFFRRRLPGHAHHLVYPAGPAPLARADLAPSRALVFVGAAHDANLRALEWYQREVAPRLGPDAPVLSVAGGVAGALRARLGPALSPALDCVGEVPDATSFYATARAVVGPFVSGSGISVKTIEALGLGLPFVGTAKAFRGIPVSEVLAAGLPIHDSADALAAGIRAALADPAPLVAAGRELCARLFSPERFERTFARALADAGVP